jgi:DivIVA domain-containing protein
MRGSDGVLMGILDGVEGWVLILFAVTTASGPLRQLRRARRSGARLREAPDSVWTGLLLSLAWACFGVSALVRPHNVWSGWGFLLAAIAALASVAAIGTVSRRSYGVAWWRFWVGATPLPSDAEPPGSDLAVTLGSGSAIVLDATTADLIERIKNATFATTRFSAGYDEEDVDAFLDKVVAVLGQAGRPDHGELSNPQFTTVRLRPGYARQDVDRLLREITQAALA